MQETVLITGVSREKGLGFETATQLTAAGYKVLISARNLEKATALGAKIGAQAYALDIRIQPYLPTSLSCTLPHHDIFASIRTATLPNLKGEIAIHLNETKRL